MRILWFHWENYLSTNLPLMLFDLNQMSKLFSSLVECTIFLVHGKEQWECENKGPIEKMRQLFLEAVLIYSLCFPFKYITPWFGVTWETVCVCNSLVWEERDFKNSTQNFLSCQGKISDFSLIGFLESTEELPMYISSTDTHFVPSTLPSSFFPQFWVNHHFCYFLFFYF